MSTRIGMNMAECAEYSTELPEFATESSDFDQIWIRINSRKKYDFFPEIYMGVQELCASHIHLAIRPVHIMENRDLLIASQVLLNDDILQNEAIAKDRDSDSDISDGVFVGDGGSDDDAPAGRRKGRWWVRP